MIVCRWEERRGRKVSEGGVGGGVGIGRMGRESTRLLLDTCD